MKILVTNDDGVHAEGLWALVRELKKIGSVTVVAPDGERSAIGTAVTLFEPLHASEVCAPEEGVTTFAIDGSPSDCVILALGKLISDKADMVVLTTHGRGAEDVDRVSAEFGSVAKKVIANSPVPVHLVNPLKK